MTRHKIVPGAVHGCPPSAAAPPSSLPLAHQLMGVGAAIGLAVWGYLFIAFVCSAFTL